jgi:hypothetical protein
MNGSNERAAKVSVVFVIEDTGLSRRCKVRPASKAGIFHLDTHPTLIRMEAYTTDSKQCAVDGALPSASEAEDRTLYRNAPISLNWRV